MVLHSVLLFDDENLVLEADFPAFIESHFHSLAMTEAFDEFCDAKNYSPSRFVYCTAEHMDKILEEFCKWVIAYRCKHFEIEVDGSRILGIE